MSDSQSHTTISSLSYKNRMMAAIIMAELLCLALVLFWPLPDAQKEPVIFSDDDEIAIQAPVRTQQQNAPPPPPAPQVPIPVPNDEVIQEEIEFPEDIFSESYDTLSTTAGEGGQGDDEIAGNPQIGPSILRIEEPTFSNNSPEKADIYVTFLVSKKGLVEEAVIEKIFLYDDDGNPSIRVDQIDEEVIKRTIKAALNWKFRPAKDNGEPVRAYTTGIFTVDY